MLQENVHAYSNAYLVFDYKVLQTCYSNLRKLVLGQKQNELSVFFEKYIHLVLEQSFCKSLLTDETESSIGIVKNHVPIYISFFEMPEYKPFLYDLLLYPPDLLIKTIFHYEPSELLSLKHYPQSDWIEQVDLKVKSNSNTKIIFFISEPNTNFPDVYWGRSMPYNGIQEYNVYDYHLPITFLAKKYKTDCEIQITGDYEQIGNQKYIYSLVFKDIHKFLITKNNNIFKILPIQILKDLNRGKCLLIFNSLHESFNISRYYHTIVRNYKKFLTSAGMENVYFLSGNTRDVEDLEAVISGRPVMFSDINSTILNFKDSISNKGVLNRIQIRSFDFFEEVMACQSEIFNNTVSYESKLSSLNDKSNYLKHFICLNRVVKDFRVAMSYLLFENNLLGKCFISQAKVENDKIFESKLLRGYSNISIENFKKTLPYHLDANTLHPNFWDVIPSETENSFCWIVTETLFGNKSDSLKYPFVTEKTFKPIVMYMPFVMVGNHGMLQLLKKMGYKTFDKWWDESYDNEPNPGKRIIKILDTLKYIATFTEQDILLMYREMEEVLKHNHKVLTTNISGKKLIDELFLKIHQPS